MVLPSLNSAPEDQASNNEALSNSCMTQDIYDPEDSQ